MDGKNRKKPEIFLKFIEIDGRVIPLIGGASNDDPPKDPPQDPPKDPEGNNKPTDDNIDQLVREKLDEHARYLGYEDWDDMQTKILEQQGKTQEYIDKLKENYTKQLAQVQKELQEYKQKYEETVIKNSIISVASQVSVDPELVYALLREKAIIADKGVLVDGKEVKAAIEELLRQRPHLAKPSGPGSGSPNAPGEPQPQSYEELLKDPKKLIDLKRSDPELYEKLKAEYFAEKLRR